TGVGPTRSLRRRNPEPRAPSPEPRCPSLDRARTARPREGRARVLHFRASTGPLPRRGGAFRDAHHRHAGRVELAEGADRGGREGRGAALVPARAPASGDGSGRGGAVCGASRAGTGARRMGASPPIPLSAGRRGGATG